MSTFARYGYAKTSMTDVAREAGISRPGLYAWFSSKEEVFRAAAEQSVARDLAAAAEALVDPTRPLPDRVLAALELWAGRYVGPVSREVPALIEAHPELLGPVATAAPAKFQRLLRTAVGEVADGARARAVTQTLVSASIGVKHQARSPADYRRRMRVTVGLLLG